MLNFQTFILLLCTVPVIFKTSEGYTYLHQRKLNEEPIQAEVELLIVCDNEFSNRFKHDRQRIIDYWTVYMTDVNMRFKTLSSVNISFRVSSLVVINDTQDQPFIEHARNTDGSISLNRVWERFGKWAYNFQMNHTGFDIGLLVTGARLSDKDVTPAYSKSESACLSNETSKIHQSTIAMHSSATWGNTCASLEIALANMLGAKYDDDTFCSSDKYLMTRDACNSRQYMFSKCSGAAIAKFLKSSQASCLYATAAVGINILAEATVTHPPNLDEQCAMITDNKNAVETKTNSSCVLSKCTVLENGHSKYLKMLSPVDNTPCEKEKICFRGHCLPQGLLLRNLGSNKCLSSGKRFSRREYPKMVNCSENPTPLDQLRILNNDHKGKLLTSPYWSPEQFLYTPEMDECLSVNLDDHGALGNIPRYASCLSAEKDHLGWDFIEVFKGSKEFLLSHRHTSSCAKVLPDNSIRLYKACDKNDDRMRWTLSQQPIVSLGWFNNTNVLESSKMIHSKRNTGPVNGPKFEDSSFNLILIGILCFCLVSLCISVLVYFLRCYRKVKQTPSNIKCSYESVKVKVET